MYINLKKTLIRFHIIFFIFFVCGFQNIFAIGYIDSIIGNEIFTYDKEKKINLEELDEININQKIFVGDSSQVTIILDDGSTIILKNKTIFEIMTYEDIFSENPHYSLNVSEGDINIETGELPKLKKNSSYIQTPIGNLFLNGTAVAAKLKENNSEIFLLTDSYGEQGELILESTNGEKIDVKLDGGLSFGQQGIQQIEISVEIQNNQQEMKSTIAKSAIADQNKIQQIIEKKVAEGKISPKEAEILKTDILKKKEQKIDQIISSSKSNTSLLGEVLKNSDNTLGSKILEKVVEKNPQVTSSVLEGVMANNEKLFKDISNNNANLTEILVKTVVKEANENDTSLSKIIANSSGEISNKILNDIADNKKELMIKVVAETSAINPDKMSEIANIDESIKEKISNTIIDNITNSPDAGEKLKSVMLSVDSEIAGNVINMAQKVDKNLVDNVITETLKNNKEELTNKLSESINSKNNNFLTEVIVAKALQTGNTDLVSKAVQINVINTNNATSANKVTSQNQPSNAIDNQTKPDKRNAEIASSNNIAKLNMIINQEVEKIKTVDPSFAVDKTLTKSLNEILASPN